MKIIFAVIVAVCFSACASTVPRQRVHSAATLPRLIHVDSTAFQSNAAKTVDFGFGYQHAPSYTDDGSVQGGNAYFATFALRVPGVTLGATPFLSHANASVEGRSSAGIFTFLSWRAYQGTSWNISTQFSYAATSKVTLETGCKHPSFQLIGTDCPAQPNSQSRAEVHPKELGGLVLLERNVSNTFGFLFAPGVYYQMINASNRLDSDPRLDFETRNSSWSPALQAGLKIRLGTNNSLSLLGGVHSIKSFGPSEVKRRYYPSASAQLLF